jgi:hypothetical protein
MKKSLLLIFFPQLLFLGCTPSSSEPLPGKTTFVFNFENNAEGWEVGYADYPVGLSITDSLKLYQFSYGHTLLPGPIIPKQSGIKVSGHNRSDDLFMFIRKKITGLSPGTQYQLYFEVEMASNVPTNALGVGGAPGESVHLKAGASAKEPVVARDNQNYYRINLDKGNQSVGGADLINIGNIGVTDTTTAYTLIQRSNPTPFSQRTGAEGELWIIIGTDSGFEGLTTLYYSAIKITLQK